MSRNSATVDHVHDHLGVSAQRYSYNAKLTKGNDSWITVYHNMMIDKHSRESVILDQSCLDQKSVEAMRQVVIQQLRCIKQFEKHVLCILSTDVTGNRFGRPESTRLSFV